VRDRERGEGEKYMEGDNRGREWKRGGVEREWEIRGDIEYE